jgi:hypothetical protein
MNDIVLSVDAANDSNPANETFSLVSPFSEGKSTWLKDGTMREDHDIVTFYGALPKRSGNFQGVYRSGIKATHGVEVEGVDSTTSLDSDIILNLSVSVPVGTATADLVLVRQRLIAALDDDTLMNDLMLNGNAFPSQS